MTMYDRKDYGFSKKVEDTRLLSDNYNAYIIFGKTKINLSDFGLKTIKWEAEDELIIRKPCTMKEKLPIIRRGGFHIDFSWEKNSPDLIMFLLDQNIAYLDGYAINNNQVKERDTSYIGIGQNLRTGLKYRSEVKNSDVNSVFVQYQGRIPTTFLTVNFDLQINIQHFSTNVETYYFRNGVLYSPSQSTEENSSPITEGVRGYFPTVEIIRNKLTTQPEVMSLIQNALANMMNLGYKEQDLPDRSRVVINPDNKNLLNK